MLEEEINRVAKRAIDVFGFEAQRMMFFEEIAELQNAVAKKSRGRDTADHIAEEIADVQIMLVQLAQMYQIGPEVVSYTEKKIKRLSERLDSIEENGEEDADELQA